MSLRQRLILLIGSQVIVSAVVAVIAVSVISHRAAREHSAASLRSLSDRAQSAVAAEVARLDSVARTVGGSITRQVQAAQLAGASVAWDRFGLESVVPKGHFVEVLGASSERLYSSRGNDACTCSPTSGPQALHPVAGGPESQARCAVPVILGAAPLLDLRGERIGAVLVGRAMDRSFVRQIALVVGEPVALWGPDGSPIGGTGQLETPQLAHLVAADTLAALALGGRAMGAAQADLPGSMTCVWALTPGQGEAPAAYMGIVAPIAVLGGPDWAVVVAIVASAAACLGLVFLSVVGIGARLSRDMDTLVTSTRAVGHGNLETRVDLEELGELHPLGLAFNDMAEALSSSTSRLRDSESRLLRAHVATRRAYEDALSSLAAALDTRDNETREHSYRVMEFSLRLAREVGLSDEQLVYVERGALLHDIGKIGIPDSILLKPSALSEEEWAVMQTHPRIGFAMLASVQFLNAAAEIIYAHHERWDGAGYPRGLAGEQIPIGARLFAVADVFDALTSDRPYRRAVGYAEARSVIEAASGTQFDPGAIEAFLHVPEEEWVALRQDVSLFVAAQRDRVAKRILEFDLQTRRLSIVRSEDRAPRFLRVS